MWDDCLLNALTSEDGLNRLFGGDAELGDPGETGVSRLELGEPGVRKEMARSNREDNEDLRGRSSLKYSAEEIPRFSGNAARAGASDGMWEGCCRGKG